MRMAISPRLATRTFSNMAGSITKPRSQARPESGWSSPESGVDPPETPGLRWRRCSEEAFECRSLFLGAAILVPAVALGVAGDFSQPSTSPEPAGAAPFSVAHGNFNADGHTDLVTRQLSGSRTSRSSWRRDGGLQRAGDLSRGHRNQHGTELRSPPAASTPTRTLTSPSPTSTPTTSRSCSATARATSRRFPPWSPWATSPSTWSWAASTLTRTATWRSPTLGSERAT